MRVYSSSTNLSELVDRFKQIPFFKSFQEEHLKKLLGASRMLIYEPGEMIVPEGVFGDRLYILFNGKVRIVKNKSPIATLEQIGDLFGELSLLSDEIRSASVLAVDTAWCLEINTGFLKKLPPEDQNACYATLYGFIARTIAERLKKTTDELALAVKELEITRAKLAELRRNSDRGAFNEELALAIEQLQRTKDKLAHAGKPPESSLPV